MNSSSICGATRAFIQRAGRQYIFLSLFVLLAFPQQSPAAEKPLWELGLGGAFLIVPDYRGSNESRAYLLPYPYLVYRGEILKVEDRKIFARILKTERLTLDVSGYGGPPVDSDDNEARTGMPDLDPIFELGPALRVKLLESREGKYLLNLSLPVRAVFSTDLSSVRHEGWVFSPRLNFTKGDVIRGTGLYLNLSVGPMFADRGYHEYFYEVKPAYATSFRPAHTPRGGYSGSTLTIGVGKRYRQFLFNVFVSVDFLGGAAFEASPLLKRKTSVMGGFNMTWRFSQSKKTVKDQSSYQ